MSKPVCLIVCTGKDCRASKGFDGLIRLAGATKGALQAPCQGLCHGPIVAVKRGGDIRWFSHVRSKSIRKLLIEASQHGRVDNDLAEHEVTKRRGVLRGSRRLERIDRQRRRSAN